MWAVQWKHSKRRQQDVLMMAVAVEVLLHTHRAEFCVIADNGAARSATTALDTIEDDNLYSSAEVKQRNVSDSLSTTVSFFLPLNFDFDRIREGKWLCDSTYGRMHGIHSLTKTESSQSSRQPAWVVVVVIYKYAHTAVTCHQTATVMEYSYSAVLVALYI